MYAVTGDGSLPEGRFLFRYLPPPLTSAGRRGRRPLQRRPVRLLIAANLRGGLGAGRPTSRCRLTTHTKQKAGANISFAPAVLLLRSHSLITLARYFSDCTLVFMGDHPNFCDFVEPFQDLSYLFIGLTLWFVICLKAFVERGKIGFKIGPGVLGLMLRTAPLNSCTLECLLVDQMKFRFFLFGGVVTVIATDLLSS